MKILLVNYEYPPLGGGGGIAMRDFAEVWARRHEVHVLTSAYKDLPREEVVGGVHVHRVWTWGRRKRATATLCSLISFVPSAIWRGIKICRRHRFDVVNAWFAVPSGLGGIIISTIFRLPLVLTIIGGDIYDPSKGISPHRHYVLRRLIAAMMRRADLVTAISHDVARRARNFHRSVKHLPIEILPLGFAPPASLPPRLTQPHSFTIISVGRLIPRKDFDTLLAALAQMKQQKAELWIVGDGPARRELEQLARRRGIASRVKFWGFVSEEEKWRLLRRADVFASSSRHEGFGIVFLEAMYAGLPVVATDVGGQRDFLFAGVNALLVPPESPTALAEALDCLARDASLRARLAQAAQERIAHFFLERTAAAKEAVLRKVIHEARR
jgi:glycosyltransferase involved in cell wall biosynthesis